MTTKVTRAQRDDPYAELSDWDGCCRALARPTRQLHTLVQTVAIAFELPAVGMVQAGAPSHAR